MQLVIAFFVSNGYVVELMIALIMCVWWIPKRWGSYLVAIAGFALMLTISSVMAYAHLSSDPLWLIVRLLICNLVCFFIIALACRIDCVQAAFYASTVVALQHCSYGAVQSVQGFIHWIAHYRSDDIDLWLYPILMASMMTVGYWLFARRLRGYVPESIHDGSVLPMYIGVLLCVNIFSCLYDYFAMQGQMSVQAYLMVVLTRVIMCTFMLNMQVEIVRREQAQRSEMMMRTLLHQQKNQLEIDKQTVALINIKAHDMKKQIAWLKASDSRDNIDDLQRLVATYEDSVHTGNEALDVILTSKRLLAKQHHISIDTIADGSSLAFMKPSDIYSLLGNALDNAIEAASDVPIESDRFIRCSVKSKASMAVIHVENSMVGDRQIRDGLCITTKDDARFHGFGMRSMRWIVCQYQGVMNANSDGEVFKLTILIPQP